MLNGLLSLPAVVGEVFRSLDPTPFFPFPHFPHSSSKRKTVAEEA
jgi:hypothetical protein